MSTPPQGANPTPRNDDASKGFFGWLSRVCEHYVPDAITTAIVLMVFLVVAALLLDRSHGVPFNTSVINTIAAYHKGLWMLLAFTMQMTLILVLSLVLSQTTAFRGIIMGLSRIPRSSGGVIAAAALFTAVISYISWGLSIALAPMIAIHFCKQADNRGIKVDFLWMMAVLAGAGSIWQFGLSASGPLMMTTYQKLFADAGIPVWPLSHTIFTPASITMVIVFTSATVLAGWVLNPRHPRTIADFPESNKLAETALTSELAHPEVHPQEHTFAKRLERSNFTLIPLILGLAVWIWYQLIYTKGAFSLESLITCYLLACLVLHRSILRFTNSLQEVVVSSWPVIIMYHLYAGVAGLIQYTPVGEAIASAVAPLSNKFTFPFLTASISSVIAMFLPSSGAQWTIQGLITVKTAEAAGLTGAHGLLALSVGDHMGNLITPFWAVVGAGIARVEFRAFFGYRLVFAAIWFVIGVTIMTFVPVRWAGQEPILSSPTPIAAPLVPGTPAAAPATAPASPGPAPAAVTPAVPAIPPAQAPTAANPVAPSAPAAAPATAAPPAR